MRCTSSPAARGERVLIHGGAGGVGIAAIQLAKHLGAEIFVTAGTEEKRDFVRLLGADHDLRLALARLRRRGAASHRRQGVDVVLNSLAGDAIPRNLRLLPRLAACSSLASAIFTETLSRLAPLPQ